MNERTLSNYSGAHYEDFQRFVSYYNQIKIIRELKPINILEVGVGSKFLSNYLKNNGYDIKTLDCNETLGPDIVGDIRNMPLEDEAFDLVAVFEVLEHLPYKESLNAMQEIHRISKKYVVISVPRSCLYLSISFMFGLPIFHKLMSLGFRLPFLFINADYGNKQHYWELGRKGYQVRRFLKDLSKVGFKVLRQGHINLNTQHYFVVLEKNRRSNSIH